MSCTLELWRTTLWDWTQRLRAAVKKSCVALVPFSGPVGVQLPGTLILTAAREGLTEWAITPQGPSFPLELCNRLRESKHHSARRNRDEPPANFPPERIEWWRRLRATDRMREQRFQRQTRAVLALMESDFPACWEGIVAGFWRMTAKSFWDRLWMGAVASGEPRSARLMLDMVDWTMHVVFHRGRIEVRMVRNTDTPAACLIVRR